jgi:uncharacterized SAM-binding protein YcdF (DUF218 family)
VILVGHSFDFPRSRKEFEAAGMRVIPAPIAIPPAIPTEFGDFVPSAYGLAHSYLVLYEMLANILYWMQHGSADATPLACDQRTASGNFYPSF